MTTRRTFLKQASLMSAGLLTGLPGFSSSKTKNIGLQLYTVRSEVNQAKLPGTLETIAKAGYSHVELFGYNNRQFFGHSVKDVAAMLKRNNLQSHSGHYSLNDLQYAKTYDFSSWNHLIDDAAVLGNKYLVIPYMDGSHRKTDDYKLLAERLNKAGELSKKAGMRAGYHNHDFEFIQQDGTSGWEILLKETDPELVAIEMDIYWVYHAGQDAVSWFKKHPGRFPLWHVKDLTSTPKKMSTIVGTGEIDFKKIYAERKTAGLEHFIIEQEEYSKHVFDCIRESFDYSAKHIVQ